MGGQRAQERPVHGAHAVLVALGLLALVRGVGHRAHDLLDPLVEHGQEALLLVGEVLVEGRLGHAGLAADGLGAGVRVAEAREDRGGRGEEPAALDVEPHLQRRGVPAARDRDAVTLDGHRHIVGGYAPADGIARTGGDDAAPRLVGAAGCGLPPPTTTRPGTSGSPGARGQYGGGPVRGRLRARRRGRDLRPAAGRGAGRPPLRRRRRLPCDRRGRPREHGHPTSPSAPCGSTARGPRAWRRTRATRTAS